METTPSSESSLRSRSTVLSTSPLEEPSMSTASPLVKPVTRALPLVISKISPLARMKMFSNGTPSLCASSACW